MPPTQAILPPLEKYGPPAPIKYGPPAPEQYGPFLPPGWHPDYSGDMHAGQDMQDAAGFGKGAAIGPPPPPQMPDYTPLSLQDQKDRNPGTQSGGSKNLKNVLTRRPTQDDSDKDCGHLAWSIGSGRHMDDAASGNLP